MEKLITFKCPKLIKGCAIIYDNFIIDYINNNPSVVRFHNILTNEVISKSFNPNSNSYINEIYVNHGRLFIIQDEKCKIYDLIDDLNLIREIKFKDLTACTFSNDGNTILLLSETSHKCKLINLLSDNNQKHKYNDGNAYIINDKIYRRLYTPHNNCYETYDLSFNHIERKSCDHTNILANENSIFDALHSQYSIHIYNKESNKYFIVEFKDVFPFPTQVLYKSIFSNILIISGHRREGSAIREDVCHIFEIVNGGETLSCIGTLPVDFSKVKYLNNGTIMSKDKDDVYSIYSLKDFKNGEINYNYEKPKG